MMRRKPLAKNEDWREDEKGKKNGRERERGSGGI